METNDDRKFTSRTSPRHQSPSDSPGGSRPRTGPRGGIPRCCHPIGGSHGSLGRPGSHA